MAEQRLEKIMCCTGESFDSRTAPLALRGFHLLAMAQTRIGQSLPRDQLHAAEKSCFYSINLLIYDLNTNPINSVRPKGCVEMRVI